MSFSITLTGWEDGQRVTRTLNEPDRWTVHTADRMLVCINDIEVTIKQEPQNIPAKRVGVGAVLWDGSMALAAYLASLPRHRFIGMRCVELGAGVGLPGLLLAKLGAKVVLSDKASVLPLLRDNVQANGFCPDAPQREGGPAALVRCLEWGTQESDDAAALLAKGGVDLVVAADVCYVDQDGVSPSISSFVDTCATLCSGSRSGRVLLAQELRFSAVRNAFVAQAHQRFKQVRRLPETALHSVFRVQHMELYEMSGVLPKDQ